MPVPRPKNPRLRLLPDRPNAEALEHGRKHLLVQLDLEALLTRVSATPRSSSREVGTKVAYLFVPVVYASRGTLPKKQGKSAPKDHSKAFSGTLPQRFHGSAQTPVERLRSFWKWDLCTSMLVGGRVWVVEVRRLYTADI